MGTDMTTLRLVLGDQLNPTHSWFSKVDPNVVYTLMEMRQETDYVVHHAQKVLAIFAGMRDLSALLESQGHRVHYLAIDDAKNTQSLTLNLEKLFKQYKCTRFEYQQPDEWRLDAQLETFSQRLKITVQMCDSEHFFTTRHEAGEIFKGQKSWLMERFYRQMRTKHKVLMLDAKKPVEGQWNFDHENRKRWTGTPPEPKDHRTQHDHSALWQIIETAGIQTMGVPHAADFAWPLNRQEALADLERFIEHILPNFGDFQDAMSTGHWRMFHSLLSFSLNTKMLKPQEVVSRAEQAWQAGHISIATAEGFIRQILGWREYIRGMYWHHMPGYAQHNTFNHTTPLPDWFWTGKTKMQCLSDSIGQSLEHAYGHHIQRLMVIGNFSLLAGLDPASLHRWYLGIYIDAFEWVELPNVIGMSQFADDGLLATKPYVSSAAYVDRMSDYCKGCHYDKKQREGERACPYNALYWDFFIRNEEKLSKNFRLGMVYRNIEKMSEAAIEGIKEKAQEIKASLNTY
jgi:deoxyribodipyrimidine photolyase-related protein